MGWNGSGEKKTAPGPKEKVRTPPSKGRGLMALLVIVAGGLAAWFALRPAAPEPEAKNEARGAKSDIASVQPQIATNTVAEKAPAPPGPNVRMEKGVEVVRAEATTNRNGTVIERLWLANGKTKRKIHPKKPLFENPSDQLIAMALSTKPGQPMPPLPGLGNVDDDFAKSMLSPIRIEEGDSEEIREMKSKVMEARAYLVEEVKNGGTVREALRRYQADMEKCADSHLMAVQQIQEIRKTEGEEAAREFRNRVNEAFRARNIPELETPEREDTPNNKRRKQ